MLFYEGRDLIGMLVDKFGGYIIGWLAGYGFCQAAFVELTAELGGRGLIHWEQHREDQCAEIEADIQDGGNPDKPLQHCG